MRYTHRRRRRVAFTARTLPRLLDPSEADTPIYGVLRIGDLRGLASILADRQSARGRAAPIVRIDAAID